MNQALWLLLGLQLRGWLRYVGRNVTTLRGAILALIGLFVFIPWLIGVLFAPSTGGIESDSLLRYGPALLVVYCLVNVLFSSHERALYFTPAEVQFLFTGPFTRRQVLAYKLVLTLLVSVPATLIMGLVLRVQSSWLPALLLGLFLVSTFMQLFSTSLGLLANSLSEQLYSRSRKAVLFLALVVAGLIVFQARNLEGGWNPEYLREALFETQTWKVVSWPLRSFFEVMLARQVVDLPLPLAVGLVVNVALVFLVFFLDASYQEAAASASARIYARLQRLKGRHVDSDEVSRPSRVWTLPGPPYWGGVGPIFWRQLLAAWRGSGRLVLVLFVVAIGFLTPVLGSGVQDRKALLGGLAVVGIWLSTFLTVVVPFDFRGDLDRIASLKTLPISPWRIALGQLLAPTLLLSLLQCLTLTILAVLAPENLLLLLGVGLYVVPFTFFLIGLENLLFLLFPVRIMAATPGDFQALGRNVLLAVGKILGLVLVGFLASLAGLVGALVSGGRIWVGLITAWPVVFLAGVLLVPLIGLAFVWFDVGRDTPA